MEKNGNPIVAQKSSSFSSSKCEEKSCEMERNLSLGNIKLESYRRKESDLVNEQIKEDEEGEKSDDEINDENASNDEESNPTVENEPNFAALTEEIDQILSSLSNFNREKPNEAQAPKISKTVINKFIEFISNKIERYEKGDEKWVPELEDLPLLPSVGRVWHIASCTRKFYGEPNYLEVTNLAECILHQAMALLEEEFHSLLLEDPHVESTRHSPLGKNQEPDRCILPPPTETDGDKLKELSLPYPCDTIDRLRDIANSMISSGYIIECYEVYNAARYNAFEANLASLGYGKPSISDVVYMDWGPLEGEIDTWIKKLKHAVTTGFSCEREIASKIFSDHKAAASQCFHNLVKEIVWNLLNFPKAMSVTTRSAEKLFKILDIYEALRDFESMIESVFPINEGDNVDDDMMASYKEDLKSDISLVRTHIGELTVQIFCGLERSIKSDRRKTLVPGGGVHPLTSYVMNYLKYACTYKSSLEEVFDDSCESNCDNNENREESGSKVYDNAFEVRLIEVMDLLMANLEAKSKHYKDPALNYMFLINNGRYIVQKIKGSAEINALIGNTWGRNLSAGIRQYHNNYQRDTWARVLDALKNDGLMVRGNIQKPVLKERFKSFNALFEEIHRTQSAWVVSDEQLKNELKTSISVLVVPAYRSFKGRFEQHFTAGRQTEKYVKFSAEDLDKYIEDFFEGNPVSMARRW